MPIILKKKIKVVPPAPKPQEALGSHRELELDSVCRGALKCGKGAYVSWYLMCAWAYYHRNVSLISDGLFDEICAELLRLKTNDEISHHIHTDLIDVDALKAGTGFHIKDHEYPLMTRCAARFLAASELGIELSL